MELAAGCIFRSESFLINSSFVGQSLLFFIVQNLGMNHALIALSLI
jgi:hypothetical protein